MIYNCFLYFSVSKVILCRRTRFCYPLIISSGIKHLHYQVMYLLFCTQSSRQKSQPGLQGCHQLYLKASSHRTEKGEDPLVAAPVVFPSPARKHLARRRWRSLPVFCLILCFFSSRSISSEEVTDVGRRRNETGGAERSFRSQSPVLGCLLWVTLLEQRLGQGD